MKFIIRELNQSKVAILEDFLYEAIFVPEGVPALPRDIINKPELQVYITDFGLCDCKVRVPVLSSHKKAR